VRYGWHCQFLEQDLKTLLPVKLHFTSADKVIELVERGGGITDQESRLMLDQAIVTGRGVCWADSRLSFVVPLLELILRDLATFDIK
jgi:hypothetical protein